MRNVKRTGAIVLLVIAYSEVRAAEPNETFSTATILAPDVMLVSDSLTPGAMAEQPDTLLGVRGAGGAIVTTDDNGSPVGNGMASGVTDVPITAGAISIAVTGVGDSAFAGNHLQKGEYEVFFLVYDAADSLVGLFTSPRTMQPGVVQEFRYFNSAWIGGTFDAYIDNRVGPITGGDMDFFTFTGFAPGASFSAETLAPASPNLDTVLGWFAADGSTLGFNDDQTTGLLSQIGGTVPANGRLTFGVSGYGDDNFAGAHTENGAYQLRLTVSGGATLPADFNGDGHVDAADLAAWRSNFAATPAADADDDNDTDGADFLTWQRQLGAAATPASASIPEPTTWPLGFLAVGFFRRHR